MSEYSELIKNFGRIRDYMRDFFVFGFKTRNDFIQKSKRTYDNERRRIESYLGDLIKCEYTETGKKVFISVDSSKIRQNPFFKAYKSKSFTYNDLILHFYILDMLYDKQALTLDEITKRINEQTNEYIEPQTVRNKLKEYSQFGIISTIKSGRTYYYALNNCYIEDYNISKDALIYFSEIAPFGVIGSFINDRINNRNTKFRFKHHFIVNTLEDTVLLDIINAIKEQKRIEIENFSNRDKFLKKFNILPLMIYVSTQTGRRYVIAQGTGKYKYSVYRLDYIKSVKILEQDELFTKLYDNLKSKMNYAFSTAINKESKLEHFEMTLFINEPTENYIIKRLEREGRGGKTEKIKRCLYKYSIDVHDTQELMNWVKSFTGRIVKVDGDNKKVITKFYIDMKRMAKMYKEMPIGGENE